MPILFVLGLVRPAAVTVSVHAQFVLGLVRPSNTVSYSAAVTVSVHAQFVCPWSGQA